MADDQSEPPIPTFFQLTPMNPVYQENPHTVLDDLRERCPVRRDEQAGNFIFSKYNDVRSLLSDRTLWRDPLLAEEAAVMARRFNDAPIEGVKRSESRSRRRSTRASRNSARRRKRSSIAGSTRWKAKRPSIS
jgi:hypothetical protein